MEVTPLSEEAKKMWEYNQPRIEALATGTTKDKEVVKFFGRKAPFQLTELPSGIPRAPTKEDVGLPRVSLPAQE